jgi:hypothetical protein
VIALAAVAAFWLIFIAAVKFAVIPLIDKPEDPEDAATVTWLTHMRGLRHPGWTALALRRHLAVLHAILNVPGPAVPDEAPGSGPAAGPEAPSEAIELQQQSGPRTPTFEPPPSPAGGSRLLTAGQRLEAELAATNPWKDWEPFANWESDTWVGALTAVKP